MIAVVDYGSGNLMSVLNAIDFLGKEAKLVDSLQVLRNAEKIILPGVGLFSHCMEGLRKRGLVETLAEEVIYNKKPFLGICLGMQVLAESSEESPGVKGLGWIKGKVKRFLCEAQGLRVPHVGWNDISFEKGFSLFGGVYSEASFYFAHSYFLDPSEKEVIAATCDYGGSFVAAVCKDNIFGTQFHPEKSQNNGIQLLENFLISNASGKC